MQQKEITQSTSTSTITLVTSTQPISMVTSSGSANTLSSSVNTDLPIATASADVAADIAKYTSKVSSWIGFSLFFFHELNFQISKMLNCEIKTLL